MQTHRTTTHSHPAAHRYTAIARTQITNAHMTRIATSATNDIDDLLHFEESGFVINVSTTAELLLLPFTLL